MEPIIDLSSHLPSVHRGDEFFVASASKGQVLMIDGGGQLEDSRTREESARPRGEASRAASHGYYYAASR